MTAGTTETGTYYFFNKKEQDIPIVFIHGVGLTYEIWQPQLEFFKNYSTLSYDILGHGKSSLNKDKITFDDFSDQLIDLIDHLKIKKIHVVGFSIGSLIARNFAKVYELFVNHKNDENFDKINVNTLIMTGEFDIGSTVEMSNELNKIITNSQLKIIKDGKHLCGIECANDVNLSIKNFVEENE